MEGDFRAAIILICVIRGLLEGDITYSPESQHAEGLSSPCNKKKVYLSYANSAKKSAGVVLYERPSEFFFPPSNLLEIAEPENIKKR